MTDRTNMNYKNLLIQQGISPTKQRLEIASALLGKPQHISADQLLILLRDQGSKVSKATIYNTLNLFKISGLVRELNIDSEKAIYDSATYTHHHFYNIDTSEVIDIPNDEINFDAFPSLPLGTKKEDIEILIKIRQK